MPIRSLLHVTALLIAGCSTTGLERPPIGQPIGTVWPLHYCRGDMLSATYDVMPPEAPCDDLPGHACAALTPPRVTIIASPEDFPRHVVSAMQDRTRFAPSGDAVDVNFRVEPDPYATAYATRRADGSHATVVRVLHSNTVEASRFTGLVDVDVEMPVLCYKGHPAYGSGAVVWPDGYTYAMQPRRICNLSAVPVRLSLNSPSGLTPDVSMGPGACADTSTPEFNIPSALFIGLASPGVDPSLTCSPLQALPPVPVIKIRVSLGCPP